MFSLRQVAARSHYTARHLSASAASNTPTVYGHYVSQPSRSVLWLLKIHDQPHEFIKIDVLKGEARLEPYKSKFPTQLIPGLDDNGFTLAEGSAIMQYLCEKYRWDQWWPTGSDIATCHKRAKISEFLSSHHHTTRLISHKIGRPLFVSGFISEEKMLENAKEANKILKRFGNAFLENGNYVNGMDTPTIADLVAYSEIGQIRHFDILPSLDGHPLVKEWTERMKRLPYYDDVHKSNLKLGQILRDKRKGK